MILAYLCTIEIDKTCLTINTFSYDEDNLQFQV